MQTHRGYTIRKSGKDLWKIIDQNGARVGHRVTTVEAAMAMIDATVEHRVYTPEEHAFVHPTYRAWAHTSGVTP